MISIQDRNTINIKIRDKLQKLNTPMSELKLGGTTVNKNELIPLCFVNALITPILSNPSTLDFSSTETYRHYRGEITVFLFNCNKNLSNGKFTLATILDKNDAAYKETNKRQPWNNCYQNNTKNSHGSGVLLNSPHLIFDVTQLNNFDTDNPIPIGVYIHRRITLWSIFTQITCWRGSQLVMSRLW